MNHIQDAVCAYLTAQTTIKTVRAGEHCAGKQPKRRRWRMQRGCFEEVPPLARPNRAREWQWHDGGEGNA